jgi:hypothetical protein
MPRVGHSALHFNMLFERAIADRIGFDRFSPLGPVIINPRTLPSNEGITLETRVNGELMQSGNTKDMIFSIPKLVFLAITIPDSDKVGSSLMSLGALPSGQVR